MSDEPPDIARLTKGVRFYGIITLGSLIGPVITALPLLAAILIWGVRLEQRVDFETRRLDTKIDTQIAIAALNQKRIEDSLADAGKRNERVEGLLELLGRDLTAVRIRLGVMRMDDPLPPVNQKK